ncbi:MAG: sensor histidine kinase, partial [Proteobacteria bacterium]|nr:sensor histidine kinase [Pseudomonadota bacterium]
KKEKETALENERKRIAQDIHDDLGQLLTALRFDLGFLSQQESVSHGEFSKKTQEINRKIGQIIQSTRHIISDLRPKILEDFGLAAAVEWLVENFEKSVEVKCETIINLNQVDPDTERSLALFRILQESLNNVSKHAKADQVRIKLLETRQQIILQVTDNGVGFSYRQKPGAKSYGLSGIKERITLFKGSYKIRSLIGIGTTLLVQLPTSPD